MADYFGDYSESHTVQYGESISFGFGFLMFSPLPDVVAAICTEDHGYGTNQYTLVLNGSPFDSRVSFIMGEYFSFDYGPIYNSITFRIQLNTPQGSVTQTYAYTVITDPEITSQPVIQSKNPSSGASTTITWSAATVSNQNGATIRYQYFVGPSSTYSDSYHIGTTTSLSATISEANIIAECGTGFGASSSGSTCYLFVRAYWEKSDGTTGGWTTPTGVAFTYLPTLKPPTILSISPSSGNETTVKWTNVLAGNQSQPQAIQFIDGSAVASGITSSSGGYKIAKTVWKNYVSGKHSIQIAHEWYGRYAYSSSLTFTLSGGVQVWINNGWVGCEVKYYNGAGFVPMELSCHTSGGWKNTSSSPP